MLHPARPLHGTCQIPQSLKVGQVLRGKKVGWYSAVLLGPIVEPAPGAGGGHHLGTSPTHTPIRKIRFLEVRIVSDKACAATLQME